MDKILIIGCGGAGKSTLARQLGEKTGIPVVHLDKLYWHPGWVESSKEEIDAKIMAEMEKPRWIMDGNYNRTIPMRLQYCDTVIYLDYSRLTCLFGVVKRVIGSYGKVRPDMGEGCPERFDWSFIQWIWGFNQKNREKYYRLLKEAEGVKAVILRNRREAKNFLSTL